MHVTMDTTGSIPKIEVVGMYGDVAELRIRKDGATVTLRIYESQLAGVAHQVNQHLDQRTAGRLKPVEGAVG